MFLWEEFWWVEIRKWPISFHSSPDINFISPKIQAESFTKFSLDRSLVSEGYWRLNRHWFCSLLWVFHSSKLPLQTRCWYFWLLFYILTHSAPKPLIKNPVSSFQCTVFCFWRTTRFKSCRVREINRRVFLFSELVTGATVAKVAQLYASGTRKRKVRRSILIKLLQDRGRKQCDAIRKISIEGDPEIF